MTQGSDDPAPAEDLFRLKTCPACDYSLAGLPAEGVCPECGRRYDQSFVILIGRRGARFQDSKGGSWWNIGWSALSIVLVIWMFSASGDLFRNPTFGVMVVAITALMIIEVFFLIFSPRRAQWQVWISDRGIAQVLSTPAARLLLRIQSMHANIDRVLIPHHRIAQRVGELAEVIVADHTPPRIAAEAEITIVPILTGAMIFCCDLIRRIPIAMKMGLLTVSSYPGASLRTQGSQVLSQQLGDVRGRHVVVVDDILDSGGTIRLVVPMIRRMGAASVKSCVLLRKDRPEARRTPVDYVGFEIPDEFVVGYGLDYNNYYRNLPDVVTLKREVIERG